MIKLSQIAATLMMIFCIGFSYAEDNVFIKGQIQNAEGKTIYLDYFENGVLVTIDSCNINKKGKFEISVELKEPDFYRLRFVRNDFILLVLAENEKIEITADANELNQSYSITGSPASSEIQEFLGIFNQYNNEVLAIREKQNDPKVPMEEKKELKQHRAQGRLCSCENNATNQEYQHCDGPPAHCIHLAPVFCRAALLPIDAVMFITSTHKSPFHTGL